MASNSITIQGVSKEGLDWINKTAAQTGRNEAEVARAVLSVGSTHTDEVRDYLARLDDSAS